MGTIQGTIRKIDCRLGSNEDFKQVCDKLHSEGIRVVLDGVFNHAGRGFWAFQDVLKNRENSPYLNWFHINLGGNSDYNDGLVVRGLGRQLRSCQAEFTERGGCAVSPGKRKRLG